MSKIAARHVERKACVYVRQSSIAQVEHHRESTQRQYALRERAVSLEWRIEQVEIVDDDQGQSGASASGRGGFQRLVSEVALGRVGAVLGLEVSRLARSCVDWYRLLEVAALAQTLIVGWSADGRDLWVARYEETPPRIERVDVASGRARLWKRLGRSAPSGLQGQYRILVTPDGESYAYSFGRRMSNLYLTSR
jgi:Resolvase, N terminal domain